MMLPKPSRTERKLAEGKAKAKKVTDERKNKERVRYRDKGCRFPLCGCGKKKLRRAVSHDKHKGMGSKDDVSTTELMVQLCEHRHQFGRVSRHKGTMRTEHLTDRGYNGPVAWLVDLGAVFPHMQATHDTSVVSRWFEVAREERPGQLLPLTPMQKSVLEELAKMADF